MCISCNQNTFPTVTIQGPPGTAGARGTDGVWGGVCAWYQFSSNTGGTDPGPGILSFNGPDLSTVTKLYISYTEQNAIDVTALVSVLGTPSNTIKALIRVSSKTDESQVQYYAITDFTDHTTFGEFDITNIGSSGVAPWTSGDDLLFCPALSGETAFQLQTIDPVGDEIAPGDGIDYPAAIQGDVYRAISSGKVGTTSGQNPPNCIRIFTNDILYCIADTPGGDQATSGADWFVFTAPRGLVPESDTNGDSNFILNGDDYETNTASGTSAVNLSIGLLNVLSNSTINLVLGGGDGSSGNFVTGSNENGVFGQRLILTSSNDNLVTGQQNVLTSSNGNVVGGTSHNIANSDRNGVFGFASTLANTSVNNVIAGTVHNLNASDNNLVGGSTNILIGDHNIIGGFQNDNQGSQSLMVGYDNEINGNLGSTFMNVGVFGSGVEANIRNAIYLGSSDASTTYGAGAAQMALIGISGTTLDVRSPLSQPLTFSSNITGGAANANLAVPTDSVWYFEANFVASQIAVGNNHTNTSQVGDTVGFSCAGACMNLGGAMTMLDLKWFDSRGRWTPDPAGGALPHVRRFSRYNNGVQADVLIAQPRVNFSGTNLRFQIFFPGFQGVMPSTGITEPPFGELAAGVTLTADAVTTGAIAAPAIATATYRTPIVDIYGGSAYYGGSGFGALATATLTNTTIANNLYICSGGTGYSNGNLIFSTGDATGTYTTTGGVVTGVTLTSGGAGVYNVSNIPTITFSAAGTGAQVIPFLTPTNVTSLTVTAGGAGYTAVPNTNVYDGGTTVCNGGNLGSFIGSGVVKVTQIKF